MITGEQIKSARALLRWNQTQLAERAGISVETVKRLERMKGNVSAYAATVEAVEQAFETAGIEFLDNGGPGVRLRRRQG